MALGKGSKDSCVQESELPEVCFHAREVGNGRVWVQIRKKKSKDTFAVWVTGGHKSRVTDEKIGRMILEASLESGVLHINTKSKITDLLVAKIRKILAA